jgi:hypothetical protein
LAKPVGKDLLLDGFEVLLRLSNSPDALFTSLFIDVLDLRSGRVVDYLMPVITLPNS